MQAGIYIIQGLHIFFFNWGHFKILQLTVDAQMCFTVCVSGKMLPLYTNYKSKLSYFLCQTLSNDCWTVDCLCNYWQNKAKFTGSISITVNADQKPCGSSQLFTVTAAARWIETGIPATRSDGLLDKPWMAPVQLLKMMMIESTN